MSGGLKAQSHKKYHKINKKNGKNAENSNKSINFALANAEKTASSFIVWP